MGSAQSWFGDLPDWSLLDARERAVADAFIHPDNRERYGRCHCALRMLLADVLGIAPAEVPVVVGRPASRSWQIRHSE